MSLLPRDTGPCVGFPSGKEWNRIEQRTEIVHIFRPIIIYEVIVIICAYQIWINQSGSDTKIYFLKISYFENSFVILMLIVLTLVSDRTGWEEDLGNSLLSHHVSPLKFCVLLLTAQNYLR